MKTFFPVIPLQLGSTQNASFSGYKTITILFAVKFCTINDSPTSFQAQIVNFPFLAFRGQGFADVSDHENGFKVFFERGK